MARLVSYGHAGIDPTIMGLGPVTAVKRALAKAGLKLDQMDVVEINEGLATYTQYVTGSDGAEDASRHARATLAASETGASFVRTVAYASGAGYGLLLDGLSPGWHRTITAASDVGELLARTRERRSNAAGFTRAYGRYVWHTEGLDGVQVAPFQLLASESRTWTDHDNLWHLAVADRLVEADPRLVAVNLSRNHGHQLALTAGLDICNGETILIIDADLQDPPELLPEMMRVMRDEQADVVYGVRRSRAGETAFKRATAHGFYRLLSRATEVDIPLDAGDFRLMSRRALDALLSMPEQARFIRGMVAWIGFKQVPILYNREMRFAGETKYPLRKMLRFAFDALTGFSSAPLKLASHAGLALALGSVLLIAYIGYGWLAGRSIPGWTSLMLVVVILGAVQMFVLALMGEYIGRLYNESKRRPLYIVSEIAAANGIEHVLR